MSNQSLWNKDFLLDTGINFVVYLIYYLLMVIIAVVAKDQLHASLGEAGLASGIFIVGTLLARLQFGKAIELYGRRKSLYGGIILYFVTTLLYFSYPQSRYSSLLSASSTAWPMASSRQRRTRLSLPVFLPISGVKASTTTA